MGVCETVIVCDVILPGPLPLLATIEIVYTPAAPNKIVGFCEEVVVIVAVGVTLQLHPVG